MLLGLTAAAGVVAGCLGALLGIGGGVILVPLLNVGMGLSFRDAAAVSLTGVLATGTSVAASSAGRARMNTRLAITLLVFSVTGAAVGAEVLTLISERAYEIIFGLTTALITTVMLLRLDKRNILPADHGDLGLLGGTFYDEDTRDEVAYRVKRVPAAATVSFGAGMLATFVGIGGGILVVPALNSWCGVPLRVAAASSALMIGVTAVPGALTHQAGGFLHDYRLAGAAALGVLAGFRIGLRIGPSAPVRFLKVLMAVILALVAVQYLFLR